MSETKEVKAPLTNKKKIIIIIACILAAIALCAVIIVIAVNSVGGKTVLEGEFVMSVSADRELSSVYKFEGERVSCTYTEGNELITTEYTYKITKAGEGRVITLTDIETGVKKTLSFSEMKKDGELDAVIINNAIYYKK